MSGSSAERLIVFVRAPRLGSVKTRLAAELGPEGALAAYRTIVRHLLGRLAPLRCVELKVAPADGAGETREWLQPGWTVTPQVEGDLGQRMHAAFTDAFASGAARVALIGSDCPDIEPRDIQAAWDALAGHDVVLGPARDGGYWLIGLRRPAPELFERMSWSTPTVLLETLTRCQAVGLRAACLRELEDIDTLPDWRRFLGRQANQAFTG